MWFGESIPSYALELSFNVLEQCDALIVIGTSGVVYPVASFPQTVKDNGGYVVEVNVEPTPISSIADASLYGNSGKSILPMIVKWLKEKRDWEQRSRVKKVSILASTMIHPLPFA